MAVKTLDQIIAEYYHKIIPQLHRDSMELGRQSVQVVVWLVGLSTGIIALTLSNYKNIDYISLSSIKTIIVLLALIIICGVLHRIIYHIAERMNWILIINLQAYLYGYTDTTESIDELSEYWDVEEIVKRLKSNFNLNYNFLIECNVPLEECREVYISQYNIRKKFEKDGLKNLSEVLSSHLGLTSEEKNKIFPESVDQTFSDKTKQSKFVRKLYLISDLLFYATGFIFIITLIFIAWKILFL